MSSFDELDRKSTQVCAGRVVRKDLVRKVKVGANVPVYVLEYLLGKYCATDDQAAIEAGMRLVNTNLAESIIRPDEAMKAQSRVKERGTMTYIDKVSVRLDGTKYWADLVNFSHGFIHIPDSIVRKYDRLLEGGIWAQVKLEYREDEEVSGKVRPFFITESCLAKHWMPQAATLPTCTAASGSAKVARSLANVYVNRSRLLV